MKYVLKPFLSPPTCQIEKREDNRQTFQKLQSFLFLLLFLTCVQFPPLCLT